LHRTQTLHCANWQRSAVYFKTEEPYEKKLLTEIFDKNIHFNQEINGVSEYLVLALMPLTALKLKTVAHQTLD
jgi:hypothetical protein